MARQYMTKEVTTTTIKSGKIFINQEGNPEVSPMKDIIVLGTLSEAKAHKTVYREYGAGTTIYSVEEETKTYRMKVEDFIQVAELVTDDTPKEDTDDGKEDENDSENDVENSQNQLSNQETRETATKEKKEGKARISFIPKEAVEQ